MVDGVVLAEGGVVVVLDGGEGELVEDAVTGTATFIPLLQWPVTPQMK